MTAAYTVFLDRDGVFCPLKLPGIKRWSQFEWLPDVREAFARLNKPGIQTCLCTNQPMVGLLMATPGMIRRVNGRMQQELGHAGGRLDHMEAAYAPVWMPHRRRKPRPGMLHDGAKWLGKNQAPVDPGRAVMIGDTLKDAKAANAFGCKAILLHTTHSKATLEEKARRAGVRVDAYCANLSEAVDWVLAHR